MILWPISHSCFLIHFLEAEYGGTLYCKGCAPYRNSHHFKNPKSFVWFRVYMTPPLQLKLTCHHSGANHVLAKKKKVLWVTYFHRRELIIILNSNVRFSWLILLLSAGNCSYFQHSFQKVIFSQVCWFSPLWINTFTSRKSLWLLSKWEDTKLGGKCRYVSVL